MKKYRDVVLYIAIFFLIVFLIGLFEIEAPAQTSQATSSSIPLKLFAKWLGIVVIFSVFLFVVLRGGKALLHSQGLDGRTSGIQVKASRMLGPKKAVFVVQVLGHMLVLGVTETQISLLLDLECDRLSEQQKQQWDQERVPYDQAFKKILSHWFKR